MSPGRNGVLYVVAAGPGLGRSVALRFAREGVAVGLVGRTAEGLADLAEELRTAGAPVVGVAGADVATDDALRDALASVRAQVGDATALVYNGSAYVEGAPTDLPPAELRLALDVGVVGALVSVQAVVPSMRAAGAGTVLLTGSIAAERPSVDAPAVGVAKAGLRSLAASLHAQMAGSGVRVATVTIDGVLRGPRALDLDEIGELYWQIHRGGVPDEGPEVRHPRPG